MKGTLFTPLSQHNTSTQSLNVQLRKLLDLQVNLVHGWTMPGVPSRFEDVDIVVIRYNPGPQHCEQSPDTSILCPAEAPRDTWTNAGRCQLSCSCVWAVCMRFSGVFLPGMSAVLRYKGALQGEHRRRVQWFGARGCPGRCGVSEDHHAGDLHMLIPSHVSRM